MCWSDSTLAKAGMPLESDPILDDQEPFPVWTAVRNRRRGAPFAARRFTCTDGQRDRFAQYSQAKRSEEHTSELQSHSDLVCRLLLEKKKHKKMNKLVDV